MKPFIVLGAGGHAKVVADLIEKNGAKILGYLTPDHPPGTPFNGSTILGDDDYIETIARDEVELANGLGSLPKKTLRWSLAEQVREKGYSFKTLVHPSAIIADDVSLASGVQVMAGAILQPGVSIGEDSIINTGTLIDHDCKISKNCHLAPGVVLSGDVTIKDNTHLGTGATVIQSIRIGENCVIAAGTTVFRDVVKNKRVMQKHYREEKELV